jgi:hypothetical protein
MDTLRISPSYTSIDWFALTENNPVDWPKAVDIVRDRLEGRFLRFASNCLMDKYSGFVVLSIDCLLIETIQQFKEGVTNGHGQSEKLVKEFLKGIHFQTDFDANARKSFYIDIRCGLLHQAEAKGMWLIRRNQPKLLQKAPSGKGYIIDVEKFHLAVQNSLDDYLQLITAPSSSVLRANLWVKMNCICSVRTQRGVEYGV